MTRENKRPPSRIMIEVVIGIGDALKHYAVVLQVEVAGLQGHAERNWKHHSQEKPVRLSVRE
jgi:hypothetical protein